MAFNAQPETVIFLPENYLFLFFSKIKNIFHPAAARVLELPVEGMLIPCVPGPKHTTLLQYCKSGCKSPKQLCYCFCQYSTACSRLHNFSSVKGFSCRSREGWGIGGKTSQDNLNRFSREFMNLNLLIILKIKAEDLTKFQKLLEDVILWGWTPSQLHVIWLLSWGIR